MSYFFQKTGTVNKKYLYLFFLFTTFFFQPLSCLTASNYFLSKISSQEILNDMVSDAHIKTVLLYPVENPLQPPILRLNSTEQLQLTFDDLDTKVKPYKYTFTHCNADWTPSGLSPAEYMSGFYDGYMDSYEFSNHTLVQFVHYSLAFPNENTALLLSGNYIISIFNEDEPDKPILTKRFYLLDSQITISGKAKRASLIDDSDFKQEVNFTLYSGDNILYDPFRNIKVAILQNWRYDIAITNLQPQIAKGNELDYNYFDGSNTFDAGNEFRHFDIKSLRYQSDRVQKIFLDSIYQVELLADEKKTFNVYSTQKDINGKFIIRNQDETESPLDADYCWVNFALLSDAPIIGGNFYIYGQLTNWQWLPEAKMSYNFKERIYEGKMLLKQGYYNYQYIFVENGSAKGDVTRTEGNHYETENDYNLLIYYREPGNLYDKLIGYQILNTIN